MRTNYNNQQCEDVRKAVYSKLLNYPQHIKDNIVYLIIADFSSVTNENLKSKAPRIKHLLSIEAKAAIDIKTINPAPAEAVRIPSDTKIEVEGGKGRRARGAKPPGGL